MGTPLRAYVRFTKSNGAMRGPKGCRSAGPAWTSRTQPGGI